MLNVFFRSREEAPWPVESSEQIHDLFEEIRVAFLDEIRVQVWANLVVKFNFYQAFSTT